MTDKPSVHPTLAFQVLSNLHSTDYDLLATEINNYAYAVRTRTGRTTFTALEARVLFNRMLDIMVLVPQVTAAEPQDLDQIQDPVRMKKLQDMLNESTPKIEKRRV